MERDFLLDKRTSEEVGAPAVFGGGAGAERGGIFAARGRLIGRPGELLSFRMKGRRGHRGGGAAVLRDQL